MSDLIAQDDAAPSSTEPQQPAPEVAPAGEPSSSPSSGEAGSVEAGNASSADASGSTTVDTDGSATTPTEAAAPVSSAEVPNADANTSPAGAATPATTGNVLVNSTPTVDAPVIDAPEPVAEPAAEAAAEAVEPLPRESHLMLLEAKFGAAVEKLRNAERIAVAELEAIWEHIKAVI